jgi:hypothetical protein
LDEVDGRQVPRAQPKLRFTILSALGAVTATDSRETLMARSTPIERAARPACTSAAKLRCRGDPTGRHGWRRHGDGDDNGEPGEPRHAD